MQKIKFNYDPSFGTKHSRDYYRGKSFHFSGEWVNNAHYVSDDYNVDFVVHEHALLACAKSHLSSSETEPINFIRDDRGNIIGVVSIYWDFVLAGVNGKSPGIRVNERTSEIEICEDTNFSPQVWVGTHLYVPIVVEEYGDSHVVTLSQKFITDELNKKVDLDFVTEQFMPKTGGIFTGEVVFNDSATFKTDVNVTNHRIVNLASPVNDSDAVNKKFITDLPAYNVTERDIQNWNDSSIWKE